MRKNIKLTSLVMALLLLAAGCGREENVPGAGTEGGITLTPAVELAGGWSTGADTRADQKVPVTLAPGGRIWLGIVNVGADGSPDIESGIQGNYFEVTADGKLSRLPFSGEVDETEEPLNVAASGEYFVAVTGEANFTTDGITYRSFVFNKGEIATIGGDGKMVTSVMISSGGLRLNVKGTDGTAYTGADVTATLKNVNQAVHEAFETKTLTAAAPSVIWGDISSTSSVTAGTQLLELVVGGKTYKVNAPRQITFTDGRLYTFNVRVGATSITVSSDDLSIGDFEVQASTGTEAEQAPYYTQQPPLYNGQPAKLLALPGCAPYWIAPVNASDDISWTDMMAEVNTICPEGWHVPSRDEFVAMTGVGGNVTSQTVATVFAIFSHGGYWSTTEEDNYPDEYAYFMVSQEDLVAIHGGGKNDRTNVRCVRKI